jgi:Carboxypeptidase regulatory-like domain
MGGLLLHFFLLTLVLLVVAAAQTAVGGTLRDAAGKAVSGASVVLQRAEGNVVQRVMSDASGRFRVAVLEAGADTPPPTRSRRCPLLRGRR